MCLCVYVHKNAVRNWINKEYSSLVYLLCAIDVAYYGMVVCPSELWKKDNIK